MLIYGETKGIKFRVHANNPLDTDTHKAITKMLDLVDKMIKQKDDENSRRQTTEGRKD